MKAHKTGFYILIALSFLAVLASGCKKEKDPVQEETLYERLGGISAIAAVTDEFLANVAVNNEINFFFIEAVSNPFRLQGLRNHLIDQICEAAGGPCTYKGMDMKTAHRDMMITEAQFLSLVGNLVTALNKFSVPQSEQDQLLSVLGGLAPDIIGQ